MGRKQLFVKGCSSWMDQTQPMKDCLASSETILYPKPLSDLFMEDGLKGPNAVEHIVSRKEATTLRGIAQAYAK